MKDRKELPTRAFKSQKDWEAWLERNHESPGIWLKLAKKGSGVASVSYQRRSIPRYAMAGSTDKASRPTSGG